LLRQDFRRQVRFTVTAPPRYFPVPHYANFRYGIRWKPDGQAITYHDWVESLWRQPLDGSPSEQIKGLPTEKIYAYNWSPDNQTLAFTRGAEICDADLLKAKNQP
jgi:hypothetical protein